MHDLAITGGFVVDGTGGPRRRADVGVTNGRIVELGRISPRSARRHVDARGCVVAPGFVDPHTHYDPQLMIDPFARASCYHGVTSVVVGNCGFGIAPAKPTDRDALLQIFARVEEISLAALRQIEWDFETFPELLAAREGNLGINASYYLGHSTLRRYVMDEACHERSATEDEIRSMRRVLRDAMRAGAAGLSSSHSPTDCDAMNRPVPSRLATYDELEALAEELGRSNRGTFAYLPFSAVGGLTSEDGELLLRLADRSRVPVIIQGLGARSKVDAPTATWPESKRFLDDARSKGAAIYSMLMARPFIRSFTLSAGTTLYEGVPEFHRLFTECASVVERRALLENDRFREVIRRAVDHPNTDPDKGSTLPPPRFDQLGIDQTRSRDHRSWIGKTLREVANARGIHPIDAMIEVALSDGLETKFLWRTDDEEWREGTDAASKHPQMIVGVSDGGAHLNRDDGADFSSYFLRYWVREWGRWTLEEAIRALTHVPASILGFVDRGLIMPGYAADLVVFDPDLVGPGEKKFQHESRGGARWVSGATGVNVTIVNGVPIVIDGEIADDCGRPGRILRPGVPAPMVG